MGKNKLKLPWFKFKARREKEQIMWRCKEKLRNSDIVVTEDSQSRLMDLMKAEAEKIKKEELAKRLPPSPKKKQRDGSQSPTKVPSSPIKKSSTNFSYSGSKPAHLNKLTPPGTYYLEANHS